MGTDDPGLLFLKPNGHLARVDFSDRQLNLLAHAQAIELDIGSRCGGHGVCGGDRIRPKLTHPESSGEAATLSPVTEAERSHLSPQELANGWRLACQCFPERDGIALTIETCV